MLSQLIAVSHCWNVYGLSWKEDQEHVSHLHRQEMSILNSVVYKNIVAHRASYQLT